MPGQKIDKDPTVTLQADSVDSYVALKVQYYGADNKELTREEFGKLYLNKDKQDEINSEGIDYSYAWEYIGMAADDKGEVYIYKDILSQDSASTVKKENMTEPLFTRVYLSRDIQQDEVKKKLPEFNIKITAYAIQADGITYDSAKTEVETYIVEKELANKLKADLDSMTFAEGFNKDQLLFYIDYLLESYAEEK